jgi:hypothetical protein
VRKNPYPTSFQYRQRCVSLPVPAPTHPTRWRSRPRTLNAPSCSAFAEQSPSENPTTAKGLSLPNMFTARARHCIRRFVLRELLFANWAGFGHDVGHNSYLSPRLNTCPETCTWHTSSCRSPCKYCSCPLGCQSMTATLRRAIGKPLIGLGTMPPSKTHFVGLAGSRIVELDLGFFPLSRQVNSPKLVRRHSHCGSAEFSGPGAETSKRIER